jgi:predicted CXXCH cytochrome family protein
MFGKKGLLFFLVFFVFMSAGWAYAAYNPGEEGQICLGCHGSKEFKSTLKNGDVLVLYVDGQKQRSSVHGGLECTNCHAGFSAENHPKRQFGSLRSYKVAASEVCRQCHGFKKGMHMKMLEKMEKLVCTDCHGAHYIESKKGVEDSCLLCHKYRLVMRFGDGGTQSLLIDENELRESVHSKLRCPDCHFGFSSEEHPVRKFQTKRDFSIVAADSCRRCHFDKYTKTLESIHYNMLSKGNLNAPVCVDCHGAHSIHSGRKEKVMSARRCQKCHNAIYEVYAGSIHGKALISEHNQDVPVCSDCHSAHDIADPRVVDFRNNIPLLCGNCHANKELMKKYGLSTAVLESYLEDFHGVTLTFYKKQEKPVRHIAVCTDCHGIHDITSIKARDSLVVKQKLLKRCQKCHPDASEKFPDSWMSHYEPSAKRAPLVYAINLIYKIFIPFMLIGLVLQIILHIWRYAVNR